MPKKILFIISRFMDGGIETVLLEYLRYLSKSPQYKVTLAIGVYMNNLEVYRKRLPDNVDIKYLVKDSIFVNVKYRRVLHQVSKKEKIFDEIVLTPIRRFIQNKKIKQLAQQNDTIIDFDCCHYAYLKGIGKKTIVFFHFSFKQFENKSHRRMRRIAHHLNNYSHIVTISNAMLEEGKDMFPFLKDKLTRIYNPKDVNRLLSLAREPFVNDDIDAPYFFVLERLEEGQKDISTVLRAYKILNERYCHKGKLYIAGKGSSESQLKQLTYELGISENVVFLGFVENPLTWIKNCTVMIHSAKYEGLPTSMIEGLILGKPIVATDCPTGPREILDNGKAGVLVPIGDAEAMAEAIHKLLENKELANRIAKEAKRHAEIFSTENTMNTFEQLL